MIARCVACFSCNLQAVAGHFDLVEVSLMPVSFEWVVTLDCMLHLVAHDGIAISLAALGPLRTA